MNPHPSATSVIDGVPVFADPLSDNPVGTLVFGVGYRDEPAHTVGLSHLVEHLVMRRVGRVLLPHNASTDIDTLQFFATGTPEEVADFIRRVCVAVGELAAVTQADVDAEMKVVATELGEHARYSSNGAFLRRYGIGGLGMIDYGQPAHLSFTAEMVHDFAARWLHSGNAAVSINGAIPPGLRLPLPVGATVTRDPHPAPVISALPCWSPSGFAPLSLSFETTASWALRMVCMALVEQQVIQRLRLDTGLIYSVQVHSFRVDAERSVAMFVLDPDDSNIEQAMVESVSVLRSLRSGAIDAEEFSHTVRLLQAESRVDGNRAGWLEMLATCEIRGWPIPGFDDAVAQIGAVTIDEVIATLDEAMPTLLVTAPRAEIAPATAAGIELPFSGNPHSVEGLTVRSLTKDVLSKKAALLSPRFGKGLGGVQLYVTDDQISWISSQENVQARLEDVVLVARYPDGRVVIDLSDGWDLNICPADWRDKDGAIERMLARVPRELVVTFA